VLHGPSPAGQRRVARVLRAKALDQGHIGAGTGRPDQGEQVGRLAGDGGNRCDEPVVSMTDIGCGRFSFRRDPSPKGGRLGSDTSMPVGDGEQESRRAPPVEHLLAKHGQLVQHSACLA
jgi:hypothetical protein